MRYALIGVCSIAVAIANLGLNSRLIANEPSAENEEPRIEKVPVTVPKFDGKVFRFARAEEVASVSVELYNHPAGYANIEKFDIPKDSIEELLVHFQGCENDLSPEVGFPEIGTIICVKKDGSVDRISWYWPLGKGRLRCSTLGVRLIKSHDAWNGIDDGGSIDMVVRDVYFNVTGKKTWIRPLK